MPPQELALAWEGLTGIKMVLHTHSLSLSLSLTHAHIYTHEKSEVHPAYMMYSDQLLTV